MKANQYADAIYCLTRLIVGLMFASWGAKPILGMFGGTPAPIEAILVAGGWIELIGGSLIALGLLTRLAAFISSGTMAVAYFMVHAPHGFFPITNGGERAVFYCWFFFFAIFYGPGRWSIDALLFGKSAPVATTAT
jgi:putative oxidoreductase